MPLDVSEVRGSIPVRLTSSNFVRVAAFSPRAPAVAPANAALRRRDPTLPGV